MSIPHELVEQLHKGNVVLFVGADLPSSLTGVPSRADLAAALAERLGLVGSPPSWSDSAAQYKAQASLQSLIAWLREQLEPAGRDPGPIYRVLAQLPVVTFITTVYDNWLHQALIVAGRHPNLPVVGADSLGLLDANRPTVVYLFGVRDRPESLVLTADDLQRLPQTKAQLLMGLVQPAFSNKTVLILGQNLRDTYFQNLYQTSLFQAGTIRPLAYAVWQGLADWEKQGWRDRGGFVIEASETEVLAELLDALGTQPAADLKSSPLVNTHLLRQNVGDVVFDFVDRLNEAIVIAQMTPPDTVKSLDEDEGYCGGEGKKAIYAHPDPQRGCKIKYTIQDLPAPVKTVRLDFFIGILDKCKFPEDDSIGFEIRINGQKRWSKQWNKKRWDRNLIEGLDIGSDRTLEVMFVTGDLGRNEHNWAVWGSPILVVEELETADVAPETSMPEPIERTPGPSKESTERPKPLLESAQPRFSARFKLQLGHFTVSEFEARVLESPMGEPHAMTRLPYDADDLIGILKALPAGSASSANLKPAQAGALRRLGLLTETDLVPDLHIRVGEGLYQALFPGGVGEALRATLGQIRPQRGVVALQVRFDEDATSLARYPWELIYDSRRHLLPSGAVELTRYISYPESPTTLSVEPPLHVLYVESHPTDLEPLPVGKEQKTVRAALESLAHDGLLVMEHLSPPTYDVLIDRIESAQDHVLHFDGHGTVARRCPACDAMNYPHHTTCQRFGCGHSLDGVPALGYLAFEYDDESREADYVDSKALENLLYGSAVRVTVLSACRSSEVCGETLFGGVGPALIQSGVPAVVAMQVPITVSATANFMRGFYGALAGFESLPGAMTSGRRRLFRGKEWFIPTLYLRSQDDEGHLLQQA